MLSRFKLDRILEICFEILASVLKIAGKSMGWGSTCRYEVRPFLPPLTGVIEPRTKTMLDLAKSSKLCSILYAQRIQACAMRFWKMQLGKTWCMLGKYSELKRISQEKAESQFLRKLRWKRFEISGKFIKLWENHEWLKILGKRWAFEKGNTSQENSNFENFLRKMMENS